MKKISLILLSALMILTISCKKDKKESDVTDETTVDTTTGDSSNKSETTNSDSKKITVKLESKSASSVTGNAIFKQESGVVTMIAVLGGLSEGPHAIHLHESSDCSSADGTSTGGHWNPTAEAHGKWGAAKGFHKGDIGNFIADANGNGTITFITSEWCIGCGDPKKDILGKAVIVHQGVDDFTSQPTGDAGGRVSCGGIIE